MFSLDLWFHSSEHKPVLIEPTAFATLGKEDTRKRCIFFHLNEIVATELQRAIVSEYKCDSKKL